MPRRFIAILLLLSLSYQCFVKLGIVVWYYCNKDYIAANLCENRAKPEKKCCGKCYLKKQLRKADSNTNHDNSTIPDKWNMGEVAVFIIPSTVQVPFFELEYKEKPVLFNESYLPVGSPGKVFRPPSFC